MLPRDFFGTSLLVPFSLVPSSLVPSLLVPSLLVPSSLVPFSLVPSFTGEVKLGLLSELENGSKVELFVTLLFRTSSSAFRAVSSASAMLSLFSPPVNECLPTADIRVVGDTDFTP